MTTPSSPPRVALLTNAPAPYRTAFFTELARSCRLLVAFDTKREPDREWAVDEHSFCFDWVTSRTLTIPRHRLSRRTTDRRVLQMPLNTLAILDRFQPDVIISDELGVRTMWAAAYCQRHHRPLIVWWEGIPHSDGDSYLRSMRRRLLLRYATRAWANGRESARSLASYGVPADRVDLGMTGMDTVAFGEAVAHERSTTRDRLREEAGLVGAVLLFVGRLTPLKGIPELLAALTRLTQLPDVPPWSLLCVGSGPSAADVDSWAADHPGIPVVRPGFVQPDCLPAYYAAADILVQPSLQDVWSLVCLEALVAGLPQVTSSLAGAAPDLLSSVVLGDVIDPRDAGRLAECLDGRIRNAPAQVPEPLRREAVAVWSAEAGAVRAAAAISTCLKGQAEAAHRCHR